MRMSLISPLGTEGGYTPPEPRAPPDVLKIGTVNAVDKAEKLRHYSWKSRGPGVAECAPTGAVCPEVSMRLIVLCLEAGDSGTAGATQIGKVEAVKVEDAVGGDPACRVVLLITLKDSSGG